MRKFTKIRCRSRLLGERYRLRDAYRDLEEFVAYAETYSLHSRLGYKTPQTAWRANPLVEGSVNPDDFRKVRTT